MSLFGIFGLSIENFCMKNKKITAKKVHESINQNNKKMKEAVTG
jgi:hypothetical protein